MLRARLGERAKGSRVINFSTSGEKALRERFPPVAGTRPRVDERARNSENRSPIGKIEILEIMAMINVEVQQDNTSAGRRGQPSIRQRLEEDRLDLEERG
jgi:hypothetical protein